MQWVIFFIYTWYYCDLIYLFLSISIISDASLPLKTFPQGNRHGRRAFNTPSLLVQSLILYQQLFHSLHLHKVPCHTYHTGFHCSDPHILSHHMLCSDNFFPLHTHALLTAVPYSMSKSLIHTSVLAWAYCSLNPLIILASDPMIYIFFILSRYSENQETEGLLECYNRNLNKQICFWIVMFINVMREVF